MPYEYGRPAAGTIKLGFQWYPATSGPATGTILAVQGGPGYATTDYASSYYTLFQPLLGKNNLLLVNLRGTGNSSAFTCKALQNWVLADGIRAYTTDTGKCGDQLNHTRKLSGSGQYVRGSNLYTTAIAAHDVAVLLQRLQTGKVNLYGDSYGTFFSQVFTSRYASLLASVTLDAAYPVSQTDPWYPHMIGTARKAFNLACQRSVACARAAPGSSWASIAKLAAYLGRHRLRGKTLDPYGDVVTQTVGEDALIELVNIAARTTASTPPTARSPPATPAAARACAERARAPPASPGQAVAVQPPRRTRRGHGRCSGSGSPAQCTSR